MSTARLKEKIAFGLIILVITLALDCKAQSGSNFGAFVGPNYTKVFNPERIPYSDQPCCANCLCNTLVSFKPESKGGFQSGLDYQYIFRRPSIVLNAGLVYSNRNFLIEGIKDSILKYTTSTNPYYKKSESSRVVELVVGVGYAYKKMQIILSNNFELIDHAKVKYTYFNEATRTFKQEYTSTFGQILIPGLSVRYDFAYNIGNISVIPEIEIQKLTSKIYSFLLNINFTVKNEKQK